MSILATRDSSIVSTTVFVHGTPGDRRAWQAVTPFAPVDTRIVLFDLPDHGLAPDEPDAHLGHLEDAIIEAVHKTGPAPVTLVGHSAGAYLAARVLPRLADRVGRAVLISGFAALPAEAIESRLVLATGLEQGTIPRHIVRQSVLELMLGQTRNSEHEAVVVATMLDVPICRLVRSMRRFAPVIDRANHVGPYDTPTVVVHAEADPGLPLPFAHELVARGTRAELVVIPSDSHFLPLTHPADLAGMIWPGR